MKNKRTKFWIALAVPFAFIALILVKTYHIFGADQNDPFKIKGGMVLTYEQFVQDIEAGLPIKNALEAVVRVKEKSDILETIKKRLTEIAIRD